MPTQGTLATFDLGAADAATLRKVEDERYAWFAEAAIVDLDLPDAVYRGYDGEEALLGRPFEDDEPRYNLFQDGSLNEK